MDFRILTIVNIYAYTNGIYFETFCSHYCNLYPTVYTHYWQCWSLLKALVARFAASSEVDMNGLVNEEASMEASILHDLEGAMVQVSSVGITLNKFISAKLHLLKNNSCYFDFIRCLRKPEYAFEMLSTVLPRTLSNMWRTIVKVEISSPMNYLNLPSMTRHWGIRSMFAK